MARQPRGEFLEADTVVIVGIDPAEDGGHIPAGLMAERLEAFEFVPVEAPILSCNLFEHLLAFGLQGSPALLAVACEKSGTE